MNKNIEILRNNLKKALKNTPQDFAFFEVKQHIRMAINKIDKIEKKKIKKENLKEEKKQLKLNAESILVIDKMIEEENKRIKILKSKEENE